MGYCKVLKKEMSFHDCWKHFVEKVKGKKHQTKAVCAKENMVKEPVCADLNQNSGKI